LLDLHICVVTVDQVLGSVAEVVEALCAAAVQGRPLISISGLSATSDIELERVEGVQRPPRFGAIFAGARDGEAPSGG